MGLIAYWTPTVWSARVYAPWISCGPTPAVIHYGTGWQ